MCISTTHLDIDRNALYQNYRQLTIIFIRQFEWLDNDKFHRNPTAEHDDSNRPVHAGRSHIRCDVDGYGRSGGQFCNSAHSPAIRNHSIVMLHGRSANSELLFTPKFTWDDLIHIHINKKGLFNLDQQYSHHLCATQVFSIHCADP